MSQAAICQKIAVVLVFARLESGTFRYENWKIEEKWGIIGAETGDNNV
jgi:hypothetical protein